MAARLTTSYKPAGPMVPVRQADDSVEPWAHMEDWDTPARRINGHPNGSVGRAASHAFITAIQMGLSLGDANAHASEAADLAVKELTS